MYAFLLNMTIDCYFKNLIKGYLIRQRKNETMLYAFTSQITIGRRAMGSLAVKYNTQYLVGTSKDIHGKIQSKSHLSNIN